MVEFPDFGQERLDTFVHVLQRTGIEVQDMSGNPTFRICIGFKLLDSPIYAFLPRSSDDDLFFQASI
jgi:hypothetical protein